VYTIGSAARLLSVPVATIRTWEKRYGLVVPARSTGGQRLYSREQLEQLRFVVDRISEGLRPGEAYRLLRGRMTALDASFAATTKAPEQARRAVDEFAAELDEEQRFNLRLLVSELVANAVRHGHLDGDGAIRLTARKGPERIHVEVADDGDGFDWETRPGTSEGGRGLPLIAALADRWGLTFDGGTTAWFELRRPPQA
jgi:DNA-binding transcriptional MerR regulator